MLSSTPVVREYARAALPSQFGELTVVSFMDTEGNKLDHVAVMCGDVEGENVPVRVHSECLTGDVFGSLRCDCRDQLELSLERIAEGGRGIVLYMRQEGRGIGIAEKVKAYELQDEGLDTLEANLHLGFDGDLREYGTAAAMLHRLGVESVVLFTNNPLKVAGLTENGIAVSDRRPIVAEARDQNARYLVTKKTKMGHLL